MQNNPLKGFIVRAPTIADVKAVSEVVAACDIADSGTSDFTAERLRRMWQSQVFNLATDAWLVVTPEGQVVGYASVRDVAHVQFYANPRVHPLYTGCGVGTYLLHCVETWVQQRLAATPAELRITLITWINSRNEPAHRLLKYQGYTPIRSTWRMEIDMSQSPPPAPQWPAGICVRTFTPGRDEYATFEAMDEAFQDHWGHIPGNYEQWASWMFKGGNFDPTLYFLAFDGNAIAGGSLCLYRDVGKGWVDDLAVRRPWRCRGLGRALLLHSFGEFYRRGTYQVCLDVDAQNLTGATRLYERAGMYIVSQSNTYEKELRPGKELSTQSLT
ncbi:MAG: GNAT family N-acetyltransferase [Ktedonobacteraceae bacterium]